MTGKVDVKELFLRPETLQNLLTFGIAPKVTKGLGPVLPKPLQKGEFAKSPQTRFAQTGGLS